MKKSADEQIIRILPTLSFSFLASVARVNMVVWRSGTRSGLWLRCGSSCGVRLDFWDVISTTHDLDFVELDGHTLGKSVEGNLLLHAVHALHHHHLCVSSEGQVEAYN